MKLIKKVIWNENINQKLADLDFKRLKAEVRRLVSTWSPSAGCVLRLLFWKRLLFQTSSCHTCPPDAHRLLLTPQLPLWSAASVHSCFAFVYSSSWINLGFFLPFVVQAVSLISPFHFHCLFSSLLTPADARFYNCKPSSPTRRAVARTISVKSLCSWNSLNSLLWISYIPHLTAAVRSGQSGLRP